MCGDLILFEPFSKVVELHWPSGAVDEKGNTIHNRKILASRHVSHRLLDPQASSLGDPVEPPRYVVHREVNMRLRGHVAPQLMPFRGDEIYVWPDSLLAATYVLFALEVTGRSGPWCTCKGCGDPYPRTHGSQRYCTPEFQKRT